jgi:hypothetical protein
LTILGFDVFLGFFVCTLFLFLLLGSLLEILQCASEVYFSPFALLRNWLATGLEQMDSPALALYTNKMECQRKICIGLIMASVLVEERQKLFTETNGYE